MTNNKKSFLFITHLYYPALGGAERVFQRIAEGLAKKGHEITVLTSDALSTEQYYHGIQDPPPEQEILNGVQVIRQPVSTRIYRIMKHMNILNRVRGFSSLFGSLVFGPHFLKKLFFILKKRYDGIIAGPTPTSTLFYGLLCKMYHPGSALVIFPHMHIQDRMHTAAINIWVMKKAEFVLALTEAEKKYLQIRGIKGHRIRRIVNGVDDFLLREDVQKDENLNSYVLFLGQEGEHKNIPLLIKAMEGIWDRGFPNKLVIAGARANFSSTIDREIEELPPLHRSKLLRINNFPEHQKIRLLDNCLVLVNPSSFEAFGIVFLEAWARGKPVIGGRIQAVKEIIQDGVNGLLFDPSKENDLGNKIIRLLEERPLAEKMGESGRKDVQAKYVWSKIIDTVEGFFDEFY